MVFAPKERDILTLISAADVVITKDSTTGLEAVAAEEAIDRAESHRMEDKVDYAKQGAAVGVYTTEDLPMAIRNALEGNGIKGEQPPAYERRYLLELDGKAAKRVADISRIGQRSEALASETQEYKVIYGIPIS